jgi:type 1 fimbria pilin
VRKLLALGALVLLFACLGSGTAAAAGNKKLVQGTVYDSTCFRVCQPGCPPPPHCGPIPAPKSRSDVICAQASIVCPLYRIAPGGSVYTVEGSLINVRKVGSAAVIARLPVVEGHFKIRLAPGQYIFHPYMAEEQCWSAEPWRVEVSARERSPIPTSLGATNNCVVHALAK